MNTLLFVVLFILVYKYTIGDLQNIAVAFFNYTSLTNPYSLLVQMLLISSLHYLYIA